MKVSKTENRF